MCTGVNITDKNALDYVKWSRHEERFDSDLARLQVNIKTDAYNQILKLTGGKLPNRVRTYQIQFLTDDYAEIKASTIGFFDDEITFAYIPIPLLPEAKDQNLMTFYSLRPSDITDNGILIPAVDDGLHINQVSWSQILRLYDVTMS
jgi:hypothetical protein